MLIPDVFDRFPYARPSKGVLHVGAHTGEELALYHSLGLTDQQILWIDANSDYAAHFGPAQRFLSALVSNVDNQSAEFNITNNGQSSSILPLKEHLVEHPQVYKVEGRTLNTTRLDTLFAQNSIAYDSFDVINLDIQGAELLALHGAPNILQHIKAIYTEVNTKELYAGCALLGELDQFLAQLGFSRTCIEMTPHGWGDALYTRRAT